ncbi:MAG TPA: patatin-like phospholipase family protein [Bacteroidales bacterium]
MSSTTKKALVLSGGSIKGAYEAGALKAVFETGFEPESIYGISVGNLNSTFITHEAAKQFIETGKVDWMKVSDELWKFWSTEIDEPKKLVKQKCNLLLLLSLNWGLIFKKFDSILDTTPLQNLIKKRINPDVIKQAPVKLNIGTVNIYNGEIVYVDPKHKDFLDYVIASTAIPIMMPVKNIGGIPYLDGGLRDVAPFGKAINDGANEIVCVCCQSEKLANQTYNYRDLVVLVDKVMDIVVTEIINNDLKMVNTINQLVGEHPGHNGSRHARYRHVESTLIRPDTEIFLDIQKFTQKDIIDLMNRGYQDAKTKLAGKQEMVGEKIGSN